MIEWISKKLSATTAGHLLACIIELLSLFLLLIFFYQALRLTMLGRNWTPVFNIPRRYLYVCLPLSGVIMVCYSIRNVIRELLLLRRVVVQTKTLFPARNKDL